MKNILLTVVCAVSLSAAQAQSMSTVESTLSTAQESSNITTATRFYEEIPLVASVINFARKHLYVRYRSGGTSTRGFDCSGFTRFCFNHFGISLPHSSAAQGDVGDPIEKEAAQPGDLILFKGHSAGGGRIGHVGLITEVVGNQIKFIHSAWKGGVRYDYLHADYYQRRFIGVRRVAHLLASK